jgi:hypothetical protein
MQRVGSRAQVMRGTAKMTSGGLMKKHLTYNNSGKIVSIKASKTAKNLNKLVKAGYTTIPGKFGAIKTMRGGNVNIGDINVSVLSLARRIHELTEDISGIDANIKEQYVKESIYTAKKDSISKLVGNLDKNISIYAESMKGVTSKDNKKEKIYIEIIKGIKEKGIQIRDPKNRTKNNSEKVNIYELNPQSLLPTVYYPYTESFKGLEKFDDGVLGNKYWKNKNFQNSVNMNIKIIWASLYYYYEFLKKDPNVNRPLLIRVS